MNTDKLNVCFRNKGLYAMGKNILTVLLVVALVIGNMPVVYGEVDTYAAETIFISDVNDLMELSENCGYDGYSVGKVFLMTDDIDLSGVEFKSIPSFSGVFDGQGFRISGLELSDKGSTYGLFRYIEVNGEVRNLHVLGTLEMTGSNSEIGGIVGNNLGLVSGCSFDGVIEGVNKVGGIAGVNELSGAIVNSSAFGEIAGEHHTGGVVGENFGYIESCINEMSVNTKNKSSAVDLEDLNVENIQNNEAVIAHTDSGGICGSNTGIIMDCVNKGTIGYPHIGYNIAGIAGRQSGFISGCVNEGTVYGRKDVAGIVGQMEPDVKVKYSKDFLEEIGVEMDVLQGDIDRAITNAESSNKAVTARFNALSDSVNQSSNYLDAVVTSTTNYADDTTEEVNEVANRMEEFIEDLSKVTESAELASEELSKGFDELEAGFDYMADASAHGTDGLEDVSASLTQVNKGIDDMEDGIEKMQTAIVHLQNATANNESMELAIEEMQAAMDLMEPALNTLYGGMAELMTALNELDSVMDVAEIEIDENVITELEASQENMVLAFEQLSLALGHLEEEYTGDMAELNVSMAYMNSAMDDFSKAAAHFDKAVTYLNNGVKDFTKASEDMESGMDEFSDGMDHFEAASTHLTNAIDYLNQGIDKQVEKEDVEFPKLSDYVSAQNDQFFDSLDVVADDLKSLSNTVSVSSDVLTGDLRVINDQFFVITDLIQEGIDEMEAAKEEMYLDISEEGLVDGSGDSYFSEMEPVSGFVVMSENKGDIHGDINIGGIAGAMSIEMDFDPESEYSEVGDSTFNFQLQTKAVLANSKNSGTIEAKKDYAGGIVGRSDLGTIMNTENYSLVRSTDGNYIGGIVGGSYATIRNSYSMSKLEGYDYIGGIAGYGTNVYDSKSMVYIEEEVSVEEENESIVTGSLDADDEELDFFEEHEKVGAIAGDRDTEDGEFSGNVFVKSKWEGVDMISYENMAQPVSYDEFIAIEEMPESYKNLSLTFVLDEGNEIEYSFKYGEAIGVEQLPEIPKKEGYYSEWPEYDFGELVFSDKIRANYYELFPVIEGETDFGDGDNGLDDEAHAKFLVEGSFYPEDKLLVSPYDSRFSVTDEAGKALVGNVEEQWELELEAKGESDDNRYRIYLPGDEERSIYVKEDSQWNKVEAERDGSYYTFDLPSNHAVVTVFKLQQADYTWYIVEGAAFVLVLVLIVGYQKRKHAKAKKKVQEEETVKDEIYGA